MLPDRVSNPGPLTYESGALPIALRGPVMTETNPSSNAATVSIYLLRSFIVSNFDSVRVSLVHTFGGLKTMLLCIEFPLCIRSFVRPSVCQSVCT